MMRDAGYQIRFPLFSRTCCMITSCMPRSSRLHSHHINAADLLEIFFQVFWTWRNLHCFWSTIPCYTVRSKWRFVVLISVWFVPVYLQVTGFTYWLWLKVIDHIPGCWEAPKLGKKKNQYSKRKRKWHLKWNTCIIRIMIYTSWLSGLLLRSRRRSSLRSSLLSVCHDLSLFNMYSEACVLFV